MPTDPDVSGAALERIHALHCSQTEKATAQQQREEGAADEIARRDGFKKNKQKQSQNEIMSVFFLVQKGITDHHESRRQKWHSSVVETMGSFIKGEQ